jgi:hypothetical protein
MANYFEPMRHTLTLDEQQTIKTAFNRMKRALRRELGLTGGYYCSAPQLRQRTATYNVCPRASYETQIGWVEGQKANINSLTRLSDAEKAERCAACDDRIAHLEARRARFGTPMQEACATLEAIEKSKAFAAFAEAMPAGAYLNLAGNTESLLVRFHY